MSRRSLEQKDRAEEMVVVTERERETERQTERQKQREREREKIISKSLKF